ncbi:hypothetical protein SAMN02745121_01452 [Nannocystis exedens]|uniref:Type 1 periplasmic binding fold superfamily protein n=1 Tax=Nannocystis exedens TaxID=54 RepID=A0A1I1V0L3_9BACT|nr:hypothetical protein [Nannocystis exedens]PCC72252.1 hypothetical protein NAEX_05331 [Nannocystis exedens]SFD76429.1 hypothetical protein SAMN02745121_01452 [Nannocystis exedens]
MQRHCKKIFGGAALVAALVAAACEEHGHDGDHDHDHENEVISRVELTFTPTAGGAPLVFAFDDPDGDGGASGTADRVELAAGVEYTLAVRFQNSLVQPPEDLTGEIEAEAEDHMVFVVGDVAGPGSSAPTTLVTHAYADVESDYGANAVGEDLPVGLVNTITGNAAGTGELRVILRHLPEVNGQPQKTGELAADLAAGRDLPGSVDADVSFVLAVS